MSERTSLDALKSELNNMNNHIAGIKDRMNTLHVVINNADRAIPIGPEIDDLISQILGCSYKQQQETQTHVTDKVNNIRNIIGELTSKVEQMNSHLDANNDISETEMYSPTWLPH